MNIIHSFYMRIFSLSSGLINDSNCANYAIKISLTFCLFTLFPHVFCILIFSPLSLCLSSQGLVVSTLWSRTSQWQRAEQWTWPAVSSTMTTPPSSGQTRHSRRSFSGTRKVSGGPAAAAVAAGHVGSLIVKPRWFAAASKPHTLSCCLLSYLYCVIFVLSRILWVCIWRRGQLNLAWLILHLSKSRWEGQISTFRCSNYTGYSEVKLSGTVGPKNTQKQHNNSTSEVITSGRTLAAELHEIQFS